VHGTVSSPITDFAREPAGVDDMQGSVSSPEFCFSSIRVRPVFVSFAISCHY